MINTQDEWCVHCDGSGLEVNKAPCSVCGDTGNNG